MPIKVTTYSFIKKAIVTHGFTYYYDKVEYVNSKTKVTITCKEHGDFEQTPDKHTNSKQGCPACSNRIKLTTEEFIIKAKEVHGDTYDYSKVNYKINSIKVKIKCPEHGVFEQVPMSHLTGRGCNKCKNSTSTWSYSNWKKAGEKSKRFDSFKVYIIRCWNNEEEFYKIGKTFSTVKQRFDHKVKLPYNYEIIKIFKGCPIGVSLLENNLQKLNRSSKIVPENKFNGITECFSKIRFI